MSSITIIAAYRFAGLSELKILRSQLIGQCHSWGLKGTILLSREGINLFVAGGESEINQLLTALRAIPGLEDLTPKLSTSASQQEDSWAELCSRQFGSFLPCCKLSCRVCARLCLC